MDADGVARGMPGEKKIRIGGRPRQGKDCEYILLEEPEAPVQMHWLKNRLVPHFTRNCPHCNAGSEEPKPLWYIGSLDLFGKEAVILELTEKCFLTAQAGAESFPCHGPSQPGLFEDALEPVPTFKGLVVLINRGDFTGSPRVLRVKARAHRFPDWPYRTREELARIWGIRIKPRIYREQA